MADPGLGLAGPDGVAHVVQVALTPVFLLSGIGTLLGMFNLRQNRIADHLEHLNDLLEQEADADKSALLLSHMRRLRRRRTALDGALVMGALGAASTCCAAFVLFLGSVRDAQIAGWLDGLFGTALLCTVLGLLCFLADTVLAWHGIRLDGPMPRSRPVNP